MQSKDELRQTAQRLRGGAHTMYGIKAAEQAKDVAMGLIGGMDKSTIIALYHPIGTEMDPRFLGRTLENVGFRTALPVVEGKDTPLQFRLWAEGDPLDKGPMGTVHPSSDAPAVDPDVLIIPLLAFDTDCYRLGWGGGYYDRTLAERFSGIKAFGMAYAAQFVEELPREKHDWPLHGVITEEGLVLPRKS
ncbi:hypothetical protein GCM10017044_26530 [Kordiimonas sediminis]|uniref:5-formyltetrahydrofolate cyclo-ligase n=1 Tax=Kordiimonas sediminis TaxID=1735581 RepID=A0A919AXJ6_9PROT|nr:5-formyltetrahydrofolate cyclo-ligase [Kordiimonas sediminis]GHF29916.1 hypothetical protein GCM10017044_26530 [Kordiimonas sediminis]